jgi:hypothetical protein
VTNNSREHSCKITSLYNKKNHLGVVMYFLSIMNVFDSFKFVGFMFRFSVISYRSLDSP